MNKKKTSIILAVAAILVLTSVTIAFFISRDGLKNIFSVGDLETEIEEEWDEPEKWNGEELSKIAKVKNTNTFPEIIRVAVEPRWEDSEGNFYNADISKVKFDYTNITLDYNTPNSWYYGDDGYYYYTSVVYEGETTESIINSIKLEAADEEKEVFDKLSLKAVVRAEALFARVDSWNTEWTIDENNENLKGLLSKLNTEALENEE